ncbi:sugar ABC transporter substrate-binding protein [Opitutaceae bacterium TAV5]|nr:sugar ABC transporter substrate-binding protein [Opitutaceae bacterium TAV5]
MKTIRHLLLLGLAALLPAAFSPTTLLAAKPDKPVKIGAAVYGLKGEFMKVWTLWLQQHPAVKSGEVKLTIFDGRYDLNVQNDQFDTMIVQQFDAILFVPIDLQGGAGAVAKAHAAGIPVIGSNGRVESPLLTSYVGSDDIIGGEMEAVSVFERMGGKGNIVVLEGPIGQSGQVERRKGIEKALAKYPDIKVLDWKTANWSRAEAISLMENWLTAYPGKIHGVVGENDEMALGAIQAIKIAGLDIADFPTAGIDGVADAITAAERGEMVSILQDAKTQAQGALDVALRAVKGPSYKPQSDIWAFYGDKMPWNNGTDKYYNVPWTVISKENAAELRRRTTISK